VSDATATHAKKRNWGRKRWIALVLIGLGIYFGFYGPTFLRPISPVVSLPAEAITPILFTLPVIGGFAITNTMVATLIADLVIALMAFGVWRMHKQAACEKPTGWYNFVEWIVEFLWNTVSGVVDQKWAKRIFPWSATIFILVLTANLTKAIPGFEAFGWLKAAEEGKTGSPAVQLSGSVYTLDKAQPAAGEETYEVVPFLRGAATDLNFTFALAIVTMVMVQAFGVWAQGPGYFEKFLNIRALLAGDMLKAVDFGVGLLELISEIAKILSFAFRLFGNIFAGALLLSIIGVMMTVAVPAGVMLFEVFVGALQAYVFALLATVFMSQSVAGHHAEEKH
jgi:F-type H+-transporting ATPase subunit a